MFDSHIHLDFVELASEREQHLREAREVGVTQWFVPGCQPEQWEKLRALSSPDIYVGVGLHPYFSEEGIDVDSLCAQMREACLSLGAVAIGECGLDKNRGAPLEHQVALLESQLRLAGELELPVVMHQVGHQDSFLKCLERVGLPEAGAVVHGFGGDASWGRALIDRGCLLGMGASITKEGHKKSRGAATELPLDRLLIETDAPDQVPFGREAPGRPRDLKLVCEALADLQGRSSDDVASTTYRTAHSFFGLEPQSLVLR